ncbi:MAG: sigma-54-dependent Fis family transcriptional regulator [Gammaproteobacteria bacterium]|nr:sigma-54-dependent Fis family transcriptional regulator [Gammaproteobacteria bacterium]
MAKILIVDDDVAGGKTLQIHLSSQGYEIALATSVDSGLQTAAKFNPDLIILDIRMPGRSGLEGLPDFKAAHPETRVIIITAFHDMESTIQAMQLGAEDYIHKPIDIDELDDAIEKLLQRNGDDNELFTREKDNAIQPMMVGRSRAMKEVFKIIGLVARSSATILISGESGTGKELVARAIHSSGNNPDGPFVALNCAAVVDSLLESEMFGHEKGSFTGAISRQAGKFELAGDGTIFLDEIGEMSPAMQAKLLRAIQYKEFTPVGAKQVQKTNARIIAATNVNLPDLVADGKFREDLFYRLQVVNIALPPLRERKEDIEELVQILLNRVNRELGRNVLQISRQLMRCFENYHWPGNVRELENLLMKAVALCPSDTLMVDLVPSEMCLSQKPQVNDTENRLLSLDEMEGKHVNDILNVVQWHKGKACEILGVSRPRLRRIIEHHHLEPEGKAMETD